MIFFRIYYIIISMLSFSFVCIIMNDSVGPIPKFFGYNIFLYMCDIV